MLLAALAAAAFAAESTEESARLRRAEVGFGLLEEGLEAALLARKEKEKSFLPPQPPSPPLPSPPLAQSTLAVSPPPVDEEAFEGRPEECRGGMDEAEVTPSLFPQLEAALRSPAFAIWLQTNAVTLAHATPAEVLSLLVNANPAVPAHKKTRRKPFLSSLPPLEETATLSPAVFFSASPLLVEL